MRGITVFSSVRTSLEESDHPALGEALGIRPPEDPRIPHHQDPVSGGLDGIPDDAAVQYSVEFRQFSWFFWSRWKTGESPKLALKRGGPGIGLWVIVSLGVVQVCTYDSPDGSPSHREKSTYVVFWHYPRGELRRPLFGHFQCFSGIFLIGFDYQGSFG